MASKKETAPETAPEPVAPPEFPEPGEYNGVRLTADSEGSVTLRLGDVSETIATDMRASTFNPYRSGLCRVIIEEDGDGNAKVTSVGAAT